MSAPFVTGVSGGNDLDALLSSLLQPVPAIQKSKPSQAILGGIGDALLAMASVKSQGRFNPPPTFAETETARIEKEKAQQLAISSRNQEVKAGILKDVFNQNRINERQDQRDKAEADARALAEKARAALEQQKQEHEDRQAVAKQALEFVKAGGKLPDGFDLNTATSADIIRLTQAQLQKEGVPPDIAAVMANVHALQSSGLGLQVAGAEANPKGVNVNLKVPNQAEQNDILTPQTARLAAGKAVDTTGMTETQARSALAAKNAELLAQAQKERDARLNALTDRKNPVRKEIQELLDTKQTLQDAIDSTTNEPNVGGPYTGYIPDAVVRLKDSVAGTDDLLKRTDREERYGQVRTKTRHLIAGSAVSPYEGKEVEPILPSITKDDQQNLRILQNGVERLNKMIDRRVKDYGLTDEDVQFLVNPSYIKSKPPEGAIKVGSY